MVVVFNATFNTISVKSWRPVLLVEENGEPGENHWSAASHWQTTMYLYLVTITTSVYSCPLTHRADFLFYILLLCTITIFYFSGTCKCGVGCTGPSSCKCKSDCSGCNWEEHVCIINNTHLILCKYKSIYQSINSFKYYLVSVRLLFRTKSWDMVFVVRPTENNISYH